MAAHAAVEQAIYAAECDEVEEILAGACPPPRMSGPERAVYNELVKLVGDEDV
jgi:hypothetical protein